MDKNSHVNIKLKNSLIKQIYLKQTEIFSENLLEYEEGKFFENPWHISVIYGILDNILTQDIQTGKIVVNRTGIVNRKIGMRCPRNHAKSTAVSVNWTLAEMYRNSNIRLVIASSTVSQSSSFLREITSHIERGDKLNKTMPQIKPDMPEKWTDREIIIIRTTKKKDPTVSSVGAGGSVLSRRADILIADDLLNPENTRTIEARQKTKFWIDNVFLPLREPKTGRAVFIGTAWFNGDYLDEVMKDSSFDVRLDLRALIKDSKTGEGSDDPNAMDIREVFDDEVIELYGINARDCVLWPERWPLEELMIEKEGKDGEGGMGTVSFNRQYMNICLSEDEQIIKSEWLELAKKRGKDMKFLPSYNVSTSPYGALTITQGVDLAISQDTRAGWTVEVTVGKTKKGQIKLLKIKRGHFSPAETRKMIVDEYELFNPVKVKVENVAYQESIRKDIADHTDIPIEGYTTGGEKFDEYIGVNSLGVLFENGKIDLPYSDDMPEEDRKLIDQFVYECESFSMGSHTGDILMAFWFAVIGLRDLSSSRDVVSVITSTDFYSGRSSDDDE